VILAPGFNLGNRDDRGIGPRDVRTRHAGGSPTAPTTRSPFPASLLSTHCSLLPYPLSSSPRRLSNFPPIVDADSLESFAFGHERGVNPPRDAESGVRSSFDCTLGPVREISS
jgi:hypothetical protein